MTKKAFFMPSVGSQSAAVNLSSEPGQGGFLRKLTREKQRNKAYFDKLKIQ